MLFAAVFACVNSFAQKTNYDQHEAFAPMFYPAYGDKVRAADGTPGPDYWQNRADYNIQATLDDSLQNVSGIVTITYTTTARNNYLLYGCS